MSTGFRITDSLLNGGGICHGGAIATFADTHMALAIMFQIRVEAPILPTINLSLDYLSAGHVGEWVQATGEILRQTRNFVFAQTLVRADDRVIARASAVYKIVAPSREGADLGRRLRDVLAGG